MRKSTKLAILVAALVALCSISALAAGWVQDGDDWYYKDSNGDNVYTTWKQSGNNYYYLGDEGKMLRSQLISDGTSIYWVGEDGARVTSQWVQVPADDTDVSTLGVDYRWYYFASNGKAYTNATKTINSKKYRFDGDGKMVYGFADEQYNMITGVDDPILTATYYYGSNDEGALVTGWYQTALDSGTYYGASKWFYFNTSTGKKIVSTDKTINSIKYTFNDSGIMQTGWNTVVATENEVSVTHYRYLDSDGKLQKKTWVNAVPAEGQNASDYNDSTSRWFYVDYNGYTYTDCVKSINSKKYIFDTAGIMKTGLVEVDTDSDIGSAKYVASLGSKTGAYVLSLPEDTQIAYFSDSSSDGSAKTGTIKIELADDTYTFYFGKDYLAANGVVSKKVYVNGMLQAAGSDIKYAVKANAHGNKGEYDYYLVNNAGTIFTSNTVVRDGDENYIALHVYSDSSIGYVKIASGDNASSAANYFKTNGTLEGFTKTYTVIDTQTWEIQ